MFCISLFVKMLVEFSGHFLHFRGHISPRGRGLLGYFLVCIVKQDGHWSIQLCQQSYHFPEALVHQIVLMFKGYFLLFGLHGFSWSPFHSWLTWISNEVIVMTLLLDFNTLHAFRQFWVLAVEMFFVSQHFQDH